MRFRRYCGLEGYDPLGQFGNIGSLAFVWLIGGTLVCDLRPIEVEMWLNGSRDVESRRRAVADSGSETRSLFRNSHGRQWQTKNLSLRFRLLGNRLIKKGVEFDADRCMYSCRHTYAKRTLQGYWTGRATNVETPARLMGNSPQICREHYLQWSDIDKDPLWDARNRREAFFRPRSVSRSNLNLANQFVRADDSLPRECQLRYPKLDQRIITRAARSRIRTQEEAIETAADGNESL